MRAICKPCIPYAWCGVCMALGMHGVGYAWRMGSTWRAGPGETRRGLVACSGYWAMARRVKNGRRRSIRKHGVGVWWRAGMVAYERNMVAPL